MGVSYKRRGAQVHRQPLRKDHSCIIDWEASGLYPDYLESAKICKRQLRLDMHEEKPLAQAEDQSNRGLTMSGNRGTRSPPFIVNSMTTVLGVDGSIDII